MKKLVVYDPKDDKIGQFRGGGRIIQILKENFPDATFITNFNQLHQLPTDSTFLVPSWNPFSPPIIYSLISKIQYLIIYDVIPLKYPSHFPAGIKGKFNLWRNKQALKNFEWR